MATNFRHYGKITTTGSNILVVFNQLPDAPEYALVVPTNSLTGPLQSDLEFLWKSPEAQSSADLSGVLSRRSNSGSGSVLQGLHQARKLMKIPVDEVLLTPNNTSSIPLKDYLIKQGIYISGEFKNDLFPKEDVMVKENLKIESEEDAQKIASNLLYEASMLRADIQALEKNAKQKEAQAYKLCPALKKKSKVETAV